ncbi:MAG TPA: PLDc N-terminal domain-containing protein [Thermoplasmata archaeon]|nr:PLDc N-terminal domain-containing protein [Thermoplasmata archaeon]
MSDLLLATRVIALQLEFLSAGLCAIGIGWFVVWILIAIWVYKDAESRGASGALWLIIVILLQLIGLLIYLVVRPSGPQPVYAGYPGQPPPQYGYPQQQYQQPPAQQPMQQPQQAMPPAIHPTSGTGQPAAQTTPAPQATTNCPRCGRPLTYVYQYQRWFCPAENLYPWG